jgi:ubiquinone/menaquinone biosynthesis C-methylase UbiE
MGEIFTRPLPAVPLPSTGERLTSTLTGETQIEHLHRYIHARELCRGKHVLDVASGEGYGSALLAQVAASVVGIEIASDAVEHARRSYMSENLRFVQGDARQMEVPSESVDVVVSFETIEHFAEQEQFLREVRRVLRSDGMFVVSTPDRDNYSPAETSANPFHVLELTQTEFSALLAPHFKHIRSLVQRPIIGSVMLPSASSATTAPALWFEKRGEEHFEASQGLARPKYVIALASHREISALPSSVYVETSRLGYLTPTDYSQALEELRRQLECSNNECAVLVRTNERAEQAYSLVQQQLLERRQHIADSQHQLAALQHQLAALQHQLAALQHQLADCREEVSNRNQLIEGIHASTSWRVTAPLRALKSGLGGRRG